MSRSRLFEPTTKGSISKKRIKDQIAALIGERCCPNPDALTLFRSDIKVIKAMVHVADSRRYERGIDDDITIPTILVAQRIERPEPEIREAMARIEAWADSVGYVCRFCGQNTVIFALRYGEQWCLRCFLFGAEYAQM